MKVKMRKASHCRSAFGSRVVEKAHASVALLEVKMPKKLQPRSAFGILSCSKNAHDCGSWGNLSVPFFY